MEQAVKRVCPNCVVVILTCISKQTRQGADEFQGQDGQDEVKIQPAGLREGVLHAQHEEKSRVAWGGERNAESAECRAGPRAGLQRGHLRWAVKGAKGQKPQIAALLRKKTPTRLS